MTFPAGSRLAHYELLSELGVGGMGVIYRARDTRLGREVAVKVMAPHIASDPSLRRRFETEARAVGALSHPGILSIYELSTAETLPFVAMELLHGRNLRDRMAAGAVPVHEALHIVLSVADALATAHRGGIVHRDLKPENVFLTSDGRIKVLDFGLAILGGDGDAAGLPGASAAERGAIGTFGYMSPEQASGGDVDERSDVFALGCLLYEVLCGRQLFAGATPGEIFAAVLQEAPAGLLAPDPLLPPALRVVVSRAVEREPARRFRSAQEFGDALRGAASA